MLTSFPLRLRNLYSFYKASYPDLDVDIEKIIEQFKELAETFRPLTIDTISFLSQSILDGSKKILVEGANATMLDIDFGKRKYFSNVAGKNSIKQDVLIETSIFEDSLKNKYGTSFDIFLGTYPYVTSSNCSVGGVCTGLGLAPKFIGEIYGVVKAYTTRVGDGVFPTELKNVNENQMNSL